MDINKCIVSYSSIISWGIIVKQVFIFNEETKKMYILRDYLADFLMSISFQKSVSEVIQDLKSTYKITPSIENRIQHSIMKCVEDKLLVVNGDNHNE